MKAARKSKQTYVTGTYPQHVRRFYSIADGLPSNRVSRMAVDSHGTVWAGTDSGLARLEGERWTVVVGSGGLPAEPITMLFADRRGGIWTTAGQRMYSTADGLRWHKEGIEEPVQALAEDGGGKLWALTQLALYVRELDGWKRVTDHSKLVARDLAAFGDSQVFMASDFGLAALFGKRPHWFDMYIENMKDGLRTNDVRAVKADGWGHLWLATDKGVTIYDNKGFWYNIDGKQGLPYEDIRDIAMGQDGERWFATPVGAIRLKEGKWKYFASKRWLPDDDVRTIALGKDGTAWIGTAKGIGKISAKWMTLEEKADAYDQAVQQHHIRDGYVTIRLMEEEGNLESGRVEKSDNDGLWTAMYVAAQSYRYAVTGDEDAMKLARRSVQAMLFLTRVTGLKGFTARSVRHITDPEYGHIAPSWSEWRPTPDGQYEWKGETSSDEMVGHFYGYAVYYDLVANEDEKAEIREAVSNIMDHIIENGFRLIDIDGKPTTWAFWAPEKLNEDSKWWDERGTNSLEILSFLKTTWHMTGDEKYEKVYRDLITKHHYAMNTIRRKSTFLGKASSIDDNLAFHTIIPLLAYETDPDLRSLYLMGLEHHWQYERKERSPIWNAVYGALTGHVCDIENAVQTLAEMPLDLIRWSVKNRHRADIRFDEESVRYGYELLEEPLPFDERPMHKWDNPPYRADGGDGMRAEDGTVYLHPYWLARYWGLIDEER